MLRLQGDQPQQLWDELLPKTVRELPDDLAEIDRLLADPAMLSPISDHWDNEAKDHGRPTIAMASYVRLMVIKQRSGWGYETLCKEVSDSLHLRRFCLIALDQPLPHESTIRKLTRRLGSEVVAELTRSLIEKAVRERRFQPRAARIDSTVISADVRHPTDSGLAADGVKALAREARRAGTKLIKQTKRVRDRSRAVGKRIRQISRTLKRRSGERRAEVLELTRQTGALLERSIAETRSLAKALRRSARGRGAKAKRQAAKRLEALAERCAKVATQIRQRVAGEPIKERVVSLHDADARPIRRGKVARPNEFGYVAQLCELTPNTKPGARGLIAPAASAPGNPHENELLPQSVAELSRVGLTPREVALDGGFGHRRSEEQLAELAPERVFVSGRPEPTSKRTRKRLTRYRTGCEGRISHLKRSYGLERSRLKGYEGQRIWTGWTVLAYNLDTYARGL